jgi:hypothetical protein
MMNDRIADAREVQFNEIIRRFNEMERQIYDLQRALVSLSVHVHKDDAVIPYDN